MQNRRTLPGCAYSSINMLIFNLQIGFPAFLLFPAGPASS